MPKPASGRITPNIFFSLFLLAALFSAQTMFAAVPIHERYLRGASAAEARLKLLAAAESFLGTPYLFGGLDRRRGVDCSGFVHLSFKEGLNLTVPRTTATLYSWATRIDSAERQPGDLVFFVTVGNRVSHVGIYVGGGRFIHSASDGPHTGVIVSHLTESFWSRTYLGMGRALPWDAQTAREMQEARPGTTPAPRPRFPVPPRRPTSGGSVIREPVWGDSGAFAGFGASWSWGGVFEGAPSLFRGISLMGAIGYKWSAFRIGLQLRPEWDNAMGIFRLPISLSMGTDRFQIFGGPAYTFGEPSLSLENHDRLYSGGNSWLWEVGISAAFPPVTIGRGAASFYGELAWQPYSRGNGERFNFRHDLTANLRASTGIRYLWRLQ